ncbi:putative CRISPR-associated protein [Geobacillus thermodenitrificans]|uniref:putative CRISPR-associated protein n=1 Tax=Geobacillus thermodenitrificans TaxID=33940 RepID=UPI002E1AE92A|nr:putative CRISPR-associated protein [Geobacillus thermodenitrificans]MED3907254.1 putative CRISPR-associated protein [Geobacillus thermodenitrificans]
MYQNIVVTCGVSLLTGSRNVFSMNRDETMREIRPWLHERNIDRQKQSKIEHWLHHARQFAHEVAKQPNRVCAEYSMIYELRRQGRLGERPTIVLIVTETVGGRIVEAMLTELLERDFRANVHVIYVEVDVKHPKRLQETLGEYMSKVANALMRGEPSTTCFAPIGGYKVMTSLGYIVGAFLNYPTAYMHEDEQVLHEIPPVPIHIDEQFVHRYFDLLRKCQTDLVAIDGLSYQEKQCIDQYPSLFYRDEEFVCLSAFGQFLLEHEKYKHLFETSYFVSRQVAHILQHNRHQSLFVYQQMQELVKKLKYREGDTAVLYHEKSFETVDPRKAKYHLYKGASNGQTAFRLAYRYVEEEDRLYANYLWLDHDRYEREAAKGKGIYEDDSSFSDITTQLVGAVR